MQMSNSDMKDFFEEVFGRSLQQIEYPHHPSEENLQAYLAGKLSARQAFSRERLNLMQRGRLNDWSRTEVSAHVMTCTRCSSLVREFSVQAATKSSWGARLAATLRWPPLRNAATPIPAFARALIATQFAIIVALSGLIYFKPAPLFTSPVVRISEISSPKEATHDHEIKPILPPAETPAALSSVPPTPTAAAPPTERKHLLQTSSTLEIPALTTELASDDPHKQIDAAQRLGQLGDPAGVSPLVQAYRTTKDTEVHKVIIHALREIWEGVESDYYQVSSSLKSLQSALDASPSEESFLRKLIDTLDIQEQTPYPVTLRLLFHHDVTLRELNSLARSLQGILELSEAGPDEVVIRLAQKNDDELKSIIQELEKNPRIKQVQRLQ
jgi:hypothetical protein